MLQLYHTASNPRQTERCIFRSCLSSLYLHLLWSFINLSEICELSKPTNPQPAVVFVATTQTLRTLTACFEDLLAI